MYIFQIFSTSLKPDPNLPRLFNSWASCLRVFLGSRRQAETHLTQYSSPLPSPPLHKSQVIIKQNGSNKISILENI